MQKQQTGPSYVKSHPDMQYEASFNSVYNCWIVTFGKILWCSCGWGQPEQQERRAQKLAELLNKDLEEAATKILQSFSNNAE